MSINTTIDSPLGALLLAGEEGAGGLRLTSVRFTQVRRAATHPAFTEVERQLGEYFGGTRQEFDLDLGDTGTPFQRRVWEAVAAVPYGKSVSYGEIAAAIGAPRDRIRAVGAAIGANPLLVVRPCHRVVGADGALTGYAGGLERKRFLLTLEGVLQQRLVFA